MKYSFKPRQRRYRGPTHWGHELQIICADSRRKEFTAFLDEVVGPDLWRSRGENGLKAPLFVDNFKPGARIKFLDLIETTKLITVKFADKKHAFLVKLMWQECEKSGDGPMHWWQPAGHRRFKIQIPGGAALQYPSSTKTKMRVQALVSGSNKPVQLNLSEDTYDKIKDLMK